MVVAVHKLHLVLEEKEVAFHDEDIFCEYELWVTIVAVLLCIL